MVGRRKWDKRGEKWDGGTRVVKVGLPHLIDRYAILAEDSSLKGKFLALGLDFNLVRLHIVYPLSETC